MLSPLIPLISSPMLNQNPSVLAPYYAPCPIPLTGLPTSVHSVLMAMTLSFGLHLAPTSLMPIPLSIIPFALNVFALCTTLMVVITELSSYLLISSHLLHLHGSPICPLCFIYYWVPYCLLVFHLTASLVFQLIAPLCFSSPLMGSLLFPIKYEAVPPLVYKALC
jgi:hypothetical protein